MKRENVNRIKSLLDKYVLGRTSLEEEHVLMTYFNSMEIPLELRQYQAEFNYYQAFKNINLTGSLHKNTEPGRESTFKKIGQFFSKWYVLLFAVLFPCIVFMLVHRNNQFTNEVTTIYQQPDGSFVNNDLGTGNSQKLPFADTILNKSDHPRLHPVMLALSATESVVNDTVVNASRQVQVRPALAILPKKELFQIPVPRLEIISPDLITRKTRDIQPVTNPPVSGKDSMAETISIQQDMTFNLTENSTSGELAKIAYLANNAGIEYTYVVDMHKKKIHELNIVMIIRRTGERSQLWISIPKKSSFSETLCWTVDDSGDAMSLCSGKIEHKAKAKHPLD